MVKKLLFILCPKHRKCAQATLDFSMPLCNFKYCIIQFVRGPITAHNKTLEKYDN